MDFLASALGLKEILPPYLDKNLALEDFKTGLAMTVEQQLHLFTEYKAKVGGILYRSLYLVCWGNNDILQYFTLSDGMTEADYAEFMAQRASNFIQVHITLHG
ncbi:hypothetical protein QOZ80_2BG0173720 [Eleusine coracana subsp. coracana]|nr:hypothetical protein QOZ80_2BG0173720 [Eleusine coracana subsp. coracana]